MRVRRWRSRAGALALAAAAAGVASAQETRPVSREEHEALKRQVETLQKELAETRAAATQAAHQADVEKVIEEVRADARRFEEQLESHKPGLSNFLVSGNATLGLIDRRQTDSTFRAVLRPLFLWKISDELLFETKLELRLQDEIEDTELRVLSANLTYILNDYVTLGVGKHFSLLGLHPDRFYPGKLVEDPLVFQENGLAPISQLGAFARGAFEFLDTQELNYAVYVSNGPSLRTTDPTRAGLLNFSNSNDDNDDKTVGARLGWLSHPAFEIGGSIQYGRVDPHGFQETDNTLFALDAHFFQELEAIRGTLDARVEWIWSDTEDAAYDPDGDFGFGPLLFDNERNGGYVEIAYRPTRFDSAWARRLEFVGRWELLDTPSGAPGPVDQQRTTIAVLYWITATTHVRIGYVIDDKDDLPDQDIFFLQASVGF